MIEAALIALVLSVGTIAVLVGLWKGAQAELVTQEARLVRVAGELEATRLQLGASETARATERARDAAAMTTLKQEIASLENDLVACESPDVVRDRLRRLLGSPAAADSGAVGSSSMPERRTAGDGPG